MRALEVPASPHPAPLSQAASKPAPPGFASTAAYFTMLAGKAHDPDQQQRFLEVAGFYRRLARIVSHMPPGYKHDGAAPPLSRAERWKARAEECRTLADCFIDPSCREQLRRLAEDYDRMAVMAG